MIQYDRAIVDKYRSLAITNIEDLVVGKTYYSNHYGEIIIEQILNSDEHATKNKISAWSSGYWIVMNNSREISAMDNNIGNSYNPWLIFEKQEDCDNYTKELKIWHSPSDYSDYDFDDYYDWDDEYDCDNSSNCINYHDIDF